MSTGRLRIFPAERPTFQAAAAAQGCKLVRNQKGNSSTDDTAWARKMLRKEPDAVLESPTRLVTPKNSAEDSPNQDSATAHTNLSPLIAQVSERTLAVRTILRAFVAYSLSTFTIPLGLTCEWLQSADGEEHAGRWRHRPQRGGQPTAISAVCMPPDLSLRRRRPQNPGTAGTCCAHTLPVPVCTLFVQALVCKIVRSGNYL